MALLRTASRDIRALMPRAFNTLVPGNVEIKRLPPEEEPGAPAAYGGAGTIDGNVPGKFWINLRTTEPLDTRYSLPTLTYHESIPGHVWQGEYAFKLPLVRSLLAFNAYSEGWALYAEQLADELGVYDGRSDRPARLPSVHRVSGLPPRRRHRPARKALDARAGDPSGSPRPTARHRGGDQRGRPLLRVARARPAATRSATARSTGCARRPEAGWARTSTCVSSTTRREGRQRADDRPRPRRRHVHRPEGLSFLGTGAVSRGVLTVLVRLRRTHARFDRNEAAPHGPGPGPLCRPPAGQCESWPRPRRTAAAVGASPSAPWA